MKAKQPFITCTCGYQGTPAVINAEVIRKDGKMFYRVRCPGCGKELDIPRPSLPTMVKPHRAP